jgi:hypothetical protein
MHRLFFVLIALFVVFTLGCSGQTADPTMPDAVQRSETRADSNHMLMGLWQGAFDVDTKTVEFTKLREAGLHLNALPFLEPPALMNLTIGNLQWNGDIIDVDVSLLHPFLGLNQFTGFDVCGVFITDGSTSGFSDSDIVMAGEGDTRLLNPDGLTRWWNPSEFPVNNGTIFSYTDGLLGAPDSAVDYGATLNGYKYFCDDLDDVTDELSDVTLANRGKFSAGSKNTRHYTIKLGAGLIFNYAVDANWAFPEGQSPWDVPEDFPPVANRFEAWRVSVVETENELWNDGATSGGDLSLQIDVYDWFNPGLNTLRVESPGNLAMVESSNPVGGGDGYSTYGIDITDATPEAGSIDLLISIESDETGYGGLLPGKPVTAYFTHSVTVAGELPDIEGWARTWGAGSQDRGYGTAVDSDGNIYVTGNYYYSVDFDPGPGEDIQPSSGNRDSFLSKFSPDGEYQWARTWGDNVSFGGGGTDIAIDDDDNILVSGWFYGTVDFDPGAGEEIYTYHADGGEGDGGDAYVTKFDSSGNHLWARTWGSYSWLDDAALGVDTDASGNVYVVGGFMESCDFDPGPGEDIRNSLNDYRDAFLAKYSATGEYQWVRTFGGPYDDYTFAATVDLDGNVYMAGRYYQQCDFDPGVGEDIHDYLIDGNMFLTKFDPDGNFIRVRTFGTGDAFRVAIDSSNNAYVSGGFGGTSQFDPTGVASEIIANGTRDAYLNVFDEDGTWLWVKTWDSIATGDTTSGYIGYHVAIDDDDYIYCTGHFTGTADLDPDPVGVAEHTSNGLRDAFAIKFSPSGNHIWSRSWGGTTTDDGGGIAVSGNGRVYVTGWYGETADFDPGIEEDIHVSNGSLDVFLVKFLPDGWW